MIFVLVSPRHQRGFFVIYLSTIDLSEKKAAAITATPFPVSLKTSSLEAQSVYVQCLSYAPDCVDARRLSALLDFPDSGKCHPRIFCQLSQAEPLVLTRLSQLFAYYINDILTHLY